jgi:hypothetical protein
MINVHEDAPGPDDSSNENEMESGSENRSENGVMGVEICNQTREALPCLRERETTHPPAISKTGEFHLAQTRCKESDDRLIAVHDKEQESRKMGKLQK